MNALGADAAKPAARRATGGLSSWPWPRLSLLTSLCVACVLLAAGAAAMALAPTVRSEAVARPFAQSIPTAFGDWRAVDSPYVQVDPTVSRQGETSLNQPYDDILMRTYRNSRGDTVMLALAYGRQQRQEVKIHRPELCYTAQGFRVASLQDAQFALPDQLTTPVPGKRLVTVRQNRVGGYTEVVSYWIRIGASYSSSAWVTRAHILNEGLAGRVPDGMLVRASRVVDGPENASAVHAQIETFLAEFVAAVPPDVRALLVR